MTTINVQTLQTYCFNATLQTITFFYNIPNTPDTTLIDENTKSITVIEIGCCFDLHMNICFTSKLLKY